MEIVARLEQLKRLLEDVAAREAKLQAETSARTMAEERAWKGEERELAMRDEAELAEVESVYADRRERAQMWLEGRKVRSNEADKSARGAAMDRMAEYEGRRKNRLQKNALDAENQRDAALKAA